MLPLDDIRVLDLSTLLPGPLASLMLAEAGAQVIKVERPGRGDEMRSYTPKFGADSVNFAMLNRGKRSIALDLKAADQRALLTPLIREADVLIEQFRPGVLDRLGLGYEILKAINPKIILCSITGYGQSGAYADIAAHDLNFCAQTGLLGLARGADGAPVLPAALMGDIAGGTYPAVLNILLALRQRDKTGRGCWIDVAMADNLFTLQYWAIGNGLAAGQWPRPRGDLVTGGTPRYNIYRTADDRFVAAAPLEDKFWSSFLAEIGLDESKCDDLVDPAGVTQAIADRIATDTADGWRARFAGKDVCANIVETLEQALGDANFRARGVFDHKIAAADRTIAALPVPIASHFRASPCERFAPLLGEANSEFLGQ